MGFPTITPAQWREAVEKELAGKPFDKALVTQTPENVAIAPLYTELPAALQRPLSGTTGFALCVRADEKTAAEEFGGGADGVWTALASGEAVLAAASKVRAGQAKGGKAASDSEARASGSNVFALDPEAATVPASVAQATKLLASVKGPDDTFLLGFDPVGAAASGESPVGAISDGFAVIADAAAKHTGPRTYWLTVSSLPFHDAGADAADELACLLSSAVRSLDALLSAGLSVDDAAGRMAFRVAVGRDTFLELCKLRALRLCWSKILAAAGAKKAQPAFVHAVTSSRTLTLRDPWVNMLRVSTQVFAAIVGGAQVVTPAAFDAVGDAAASAQGRRLARNTGLVLRDESFLGRVMDPAGGSYTFETLTNGLALEGWTRFQAMEKEGGIVASLENGALLRHLDAAWQARLEKFSSRKHALLGVSEFANLTEELPDNLVAPARKVKDVESEGDETSLPVRRDAELFEALRARAESAKKPPLGLLLTLGTVPESRGRVGFATSFLGAGGIAVKEVSAVEASVPLVCLCGTDERYAEVAVEKVKTLKEAGVKKVVLAGRPGALEEGLREAGIDGFIYVGCDAAETLSELLEVFS